MAKTAAERTRERRERLKAAGYKLVQVWLNPANVRHLERLNEVKGTTAEEAINLSIEFSADCILDDRRI